MRYRALRSSRLSLLVCFAVLLGIFGPPVRAQVGARDLVSIDGFNRLSVIDGTTGVVKATRTVSFRMFDVAITHDGQTAVATGTNPGAFLQFFDLTVNPPALTGTVPLPQVGIDLQVSCNSNGIAVIAPYLPFSGAPVTLTAVNTTTRMVTSTLAIPGDAYTSAMASDGSVTLLAGWTTRFLLTVAISPAGLLTLADQRILATTPRSVAIAPDGSRAVVGRGVLESFAMSGTSLTSEGVVASSASLTADYAVFGPDSKRVYVGSSFNRAESFAVGAGGMLGSTGLTTTLPESYINYLAYNQMGISGDGVLVGIHTQSQVQIIDTQTMVLIRSLTIPGGVGGVVVGLCPEAFKASRMSFGVRPPSSVQQNQTWPTFAVRMEDGSGQLLTSSTAPVTVSRLSGTGILGGTLTRNAVDGIATFDGLTYDTAETMTLLVASPNLPSLGALVVVTPENSDLRIEPSGITFTPSGPQIEVGKPTRIDAKVINAGSALATATVRFYRGDPDIPQANAVPLGSAGGSVPLGGSAKLGIDWTPQENGLQSIFVIVDNTTPQGAEATPADNRASTEVAVGAAAQELQVSAGEVEAWPGAQLAVPVTVTNIGFGAATITGSTFGPPSWLSAVTPAVGATLAPGESRVFLLDLLVPTSAQGNPLNGPPAIQAIPVAYDTASGQFASDLVVKLFSQPAATVTVTVVDKSNSSPLPGALVAAQGLPGTFTTNAAGQVSLQVPPGPNGLFAYRTGYIASAGSFLIPSGASSIQIPLEAGATLSVEQVVSAPLTTQEAIDRGIDPTVAANNAVFDFVIAAKVGSPIVVRNVILPPNPQPGTSVTFSGVGYGGGGGGGFGGGGTVVTGRFDYNAFGRTETWIIIPGQVWVLKQFFEVKTFVFNNANAPNPEDVQLRNVVANLGTDQGSGLQLPAGLGLPDLNGAPQNLSKALGDLDAQEGTEATWVIRGDAPGTYQLNGLVTADLFAFEQFQVALSALATSDPFDVDVPRIRCEFFTPAQVLEDAPFTFGVLVTNEASSIANLVRVVLKEEDLENCTLAGTDLLQRPEVTLSRDANDNILSATYTIGDLDPGKSGLAQFELIAQISGIIEKLQIENGCGVAPSPDLTVTALPPKIVDQPDPLAVCVDTTATFQVVAEGFAPITYQWRKDGAPIPGATTSTLVIHPVETSDAGSYDVVVTNPGGSTTSDAAQLTVYVPPSIVTQPQGATVCQGQGSFVFTVVATGDPAPTYQWRKGGVAIPGATGTSLTIAAPTPADEGVYSVDVTNICHSVTSDPATLIVDVAPEITVRLQSQVVCQDMVNQVVFSVTATGKPAPTYSWTRNGQPMAETSATLTILAPTPADDGLYEVTAANSCGQSKSSATLEVWVKPTVSPLSNVLVTEGDKVTFSVVATGVPAPTLQWKKGGLDIPGATSASLTIDPVGYVDRGTYTFVATNSCGTAQASAVLTVNRVPVITCNGAVELWAPDHELVDVSRAFTVTDPDGDPLTVRVRCFSDEDEVPETGDGTGQHAPDFKDDRSARGLLVRRERKGNGDGRWYVIVVTADDGRGGVLRGACAVAACPHDQTAESMAAVKAQASAAEAGIQQAVDQELALPLAGQHEHGLSGPLGPKQ